MWGLLRFYLLGKLLGGRGNARQPARGCGCTSVILLLAIVAAAIWLLRGCGTATTGW